MTTRLVRISLAFLLLLSFVPAVALAQESAKPLSEESIRELQLDKTVQVESAHDVFKLTIPTTGEYTFTCENAFFNIFYADNYEGFPDSTGPNASFASSITLALDKGETIYVTADPSQENAFPAPLEVTLKREFKIYGWEDVASVDFCALRDVYVGVGDDILDGLGATFTFKDGSTFEYDGCYRWDVYEHPDLYRTQDNLFGETYGTTPNDDGKIVVTLADRFEIEFDDHQFDYENSRIAPVKEGNVQLQIKGLNGFNLNQTVDIAVSKSSVSRIEPVSSLEIPAGALSEWVDEKGISHQVYDVNPHTVCVTYGDGSKKTLTGSSGWVYSDDVSVSFMSTDAPAGRMPHAVERCKLELITDQLVTPWEPGGSYTARLRYQNVECAVPVKILTFADMVERAELSSSTVTYQEEEIRPLLESDHLSQFDYSLEYENNIEPGNAKVTIRGKGFYAGSVAVKHFNIKKGASWIYLANSRVSYDGTPKKIKDAEVEGSQGKVTYSYFSDPACKKPVSQCVQPGTYYVKATVEADGRYEGATTESAAKLVIYESGIPSTPAAPGKPASIDLSRTSVSKIPACVYSGKPCKPKLNVTCDGVKLEEGIDYAVRYSNNVNAGQAQVSITGIGRCKGQVSAAFTIERAPLSKASISGVATKAYTGKPIKQTPVVKLGSTTLKAGRDYTIRYKNNKKLGKATMTIEGKGNYKSTRSATFKIVKYKQPMKVFAKKNIIVQAKKAKKKSLKIARAVTVKRAKGKLAYSNVTASGKAKTWKVNAKSGAVTVPKGTKKGTYKLKIQVTAAGLGNYASGAKQVTVKIRVK